MRKLSKTKLREVEVTVIVPERLFAIDVAACMLRALRALGTDVAINVKICAIEEEEPTPAGAPGILPLWCVVCGANMQREDYDEKHDRYRCPGSEIEVEAEKVEA